MDDPKLYAKDQNLLDLHASKVQIFTLDRYEKNEGIKLPNE